MQKKRALVIFVIIFLVIAIICIFIYTGCDDVKYNNSDSKEDLVTEKYSCSQIEELKERVNRGDMTFKEFKRQYKVQCLRKSNIGYYAVLRQDNGKEVFVFIYEFNNELKARNLMVVDEFKSKEEFEKGISSLTTMSEMLAFDSNGIPMAGSAVSRTLHYVKEGAFMIRYLRNIDGKHLSEPIVDSIEFIDNEKVMACEVPHKYDFPIIMDMDKN